MNNNSNNDAHIKTLPQKIGVVIPAHNEAETILACLTAIRQAAMNLPKSVFVQVLVVLDSCEDNTLQQVHIAQSDFAEEQNITLDYSCCDFRCVGKVRDLGVRWLIEHHIEWVACTDADSIVEPNWLMSQLKHLQQTPADMICGVVSVDSWDALSEQTREKYLDHYQDQMGHRHIHGANLSFSSQAYLAVGGFDLIACHEDVSLVKKFEQQNFPIIWSNQVRVITSSRLEARAKEGFAHFLNNLEQQQ